MDQPARRALASLERKEGEFSLLLDECFDIVWHSVSLSRMLGWGDLRGRHATEFVHPDDLELVLQTMARSIEIVEHRELDVAIAPEASDIRIQDASGTWHTFETTTFNHLDVPSSAGILCCCRRVRDRADLPRAIEALGSGSPMEVVMPMIARLAEHSMGGGQVRVALAWLAHERIEIATSADLPTLDPRLADIARTVWTLGLREPSVITDPHDPVLAAVADVAAGHNYRGAFIVPVVAPDSSDVIGSMVAWGTSTIDFNAPPQSPVHVALRLAALAISDHRTKLALRWAAAHDPLTGLANRAEFARRLDQSADNPLLLLYIDLDDFKPINDVHGHPTGDRVLREVAQRIATTIEPDDLVGRLGGDEFAVICTGTDDPEHGRDLGRRIIAAIRAPIVAGGKSLRIGASVGVAVGAHPLIPDVLVRHADDALYRAKRTGKNTVCLAEAMR